MEQHDNLPLGMWFGKLLLSKIEKKDDRSSRHRGGAGGRSLSNQILGYFQLDGWRRLRCLGKCQLQGETVGRRYGPLLPLCLQGSIPPSACFIYIAFLHMSFEEKKPHPLLIVQPENHGSGTAILIPAELLQHAAASLALSSLLRCWRLLPRGGWGCPGDRSVAPAHLFPPAAHRAQHDPQHRHSTKKCPGGRPVSQEPY